MQTNETILTALLKPILEINAEDKQRIKQGQEENEQLSRIAAEHIKKCDELTAENNRLIEENARLQAELNHIKAGTLHIKQPIRPIRH